MEELSYEELREVQKKERSTGMLSEVPADFYRRVGGLLARLKAEVNAGFALEKAREYENALKVAKDIYSVREQKILLRALRAAKGNNNVEGLAKEEKAVFAKLKDTISESNSEFEAILGAPGAIKGPPEGHASENASPDDGEKPAQGTGRKLRIASSVPQFVGLEGGRHGPFKAGEVVFLPDREGDLLVKRNLAAYA